MKKHAAASRRVNATLLISVTYEVASGITDRGIEEQLRSVASHAADNGLLSGDLEAEVEEWDDEVAVYPATHSNRSPGTDQLLAELAELEDESVNSWWKRLNVLSQDIWHGDELKYAKIAAKAGQLAVKHAMDLNMTLRDMSEIMEILLPGMPEGDTKKQLRELLKRSAEIRA